MSDQSESVVFCEGFHDRAFWAAWLLSLNCADPGMVQPRQVERPPIQDPWGAIVRRGQFAFVSRSNRFVRLVPCDGKTNVLPQARRRLKERAVNALTRLVLSVDADVDAPPPGADPLSLSIQSTEQLVHSFDAGAAQSPDGDWLVDGGSTIVSVVHWRASDGHAPGLPRKQTLDRLVSAATVAAYPDRAPAVQRWLDSRPHAPEAGAKEYAWSYMAGWYAEHGCQDFYRSVWDDELIAAELRTRLEAAGAWRIAEALAQ